MNQVVVLKQQLVVQVMVILRMVLMSVVEMWFYMVEVFGKQE